MGQDTHRMVYEIWSEILGYQWSPLLHVDRPRPLGSLTLAGANWLRVEVVGMSSNHVLKLGHHSRVERVVCFDHPSGHPLIQLGSGVSLCWHG